jgi:hypothetical protein
MKGSREDAETRRRSWVRIPPRPLFPLDVRARLRDVHSSKPAEPLGPFGDMTLNSGGFFLPGCRRKVLERNRF